ncbi:TonB-dependent siderophore receptor [Entomobacter blattae]|uniref:Ferrichrome outer membrane transporter/phage receptor n=1 Tax=Entomobacter blattae TaxID=2762277 RepID=A0A7H1NSP1_9PROT|nr:TonB-dependent siderophore receptor [Entomobacter blattae]QNT78801.1 Ferrichrome outer membrane transporter/phage receptor [Entomobacter blattae]
MFTSLVKKQNIVLYISLICINSEAFADSSNQVENIVVKSHLNKFNKNYSIFKDINTTATKTDTAIDQTPQSITVVSQDRINLLNARSINEAIRYIAGVSDYGSKDDPRGFFGTIRGFEPSIYLDGMRIPNAPDAQSYNIEPWNLEEIDVIKGASSPLYGSGQLGGIINTVSKTPHKNILNQLLLQTGSFNRVQGQIDVGGALNEKLLWRFVGLLRRSDTYAINIKNNEIFVAPSFTYLIDKNTKLTLLSHYEQNEGGSATQFLPFFGTNTPSVVGRIARDTLSGDKDYDIYSKRQVSVGYLFERSLNDEWKIVQNFRFSHIDTLYRAVTPTTAIAALTPAFLNVQRRALLQSGNYNTVTFDTRTTYNIKLNDVENLVLMGLDFRRDFSAQRRGEAAAPSLDFLHPIYNPIIRYPRYGSNISTNQTQDQAGLYFQDQLSWRSFHVLLTGREDFFTGNITDNRDAGEAHQNVKKFTGRAGLIYNSPIGLSPYVVYATSFMPQSGVDINSQPFAPLTGDEVEVGLKYKPDDLNLLVTLAAYNLKEKNVLGPDPQNVSSQIAIGEERSRGVELEFQGSLPFNSRIIGSLTYQEPRITKVTTLKQQENLGNRQTSIPNRFANLFVEKQFDLSTDLILNLGVGVRYQGNTPADLPNRHFVNAYTVMDVMARLRYKQWNVQVNGTNMANAKFVAECKRLTNCAYAPGRAVYATMGVSF